MKRPDLETLVTNLKSINKAYRMVVEGGAMIGCIDVKFPYSTKTCLLKDAADEDKTFFSGLKRGFWS